MEMKNKQHGWTNFWLYMIWGMLCAIFAILSAAVQALRVLAGLQ